MYQHMLGKVLLLSLLSLATGHIDFEKAVYKHRGKDHQAKLALLASEELNTIASEVLMKLKLKYSQKEILDVLDYRKKYLYSYGVCHDPRGSQSTGGPSGWCGFSLKFSLDLKKSAMEDLPKSDAKSFFGYDSVDLEATEHIKQIVNCTEDKPGAGYEVWPNWDLSDPDKGFIILRTGGSPSYIERKMVTYNGTEIVKFGGSHSALIDYTSPEAKRKFGYLVVTMFAYPINEPNQPVLPTTIENIVTAITAWRKDNLYPPFKLPMSSTTDTSAQMVAMASACVRRYSQMTAPPNQTVVAKSSRFPDFNKDKSISPVPSSSTIIKQPSNPTISFQPPTSVSIIGPNHSCFICVDVTDNDNSHLAVMDHVIANRCTTRQFTPDYLRTLAENTPILDPSLYHKLILTTDTLGVGVARQDNRFIFVLHTRLNPLLKEDWKFPIIAYLNNSIAQKPDQVGPNRHELSDPTRVVVVPLLEPLLKQYVLAGDTERRYGIGVAFNQPNIGPRVFFYKLEFRSTRLSLVDDTNPQCKYTLNEGNSVADNALADTFTDIVSYSATPPLTITLPIWKIWNESSIIFHESDSPSSLAYDHLVSPTTVKVTYDIFTSDQLGFHSEKQAIATIFFCDKISPECHLDDLVPDEILAQISSIRTSRSCNPLLERSESTLAQLFANALPYIPLEPGQFTGLVKTLESLLVYVIITEVSLTSARAVVDYAVDRILQCTNDQDLAISPDELGKAEKGYHQVSSYADSCLIAKSPSLNFGISTFGKHQIFVVETKLTEVGNNWSFGLQAFYNMINNARKEKEGKPFPDELNRNPEVDGFANILFTLLNTVESNSTVPTRGTGMIFPKQPDSICGPSSSCAFSYRLDHNTILTPDSNVLEQNEQVELQTIAQIKNILAKTEAEAVNNVQVEWKNEEILLWQGGIESSHLDFLQMTSVNCTGLSHGAYIMLGENNSKILSILVYQGVESETVETSITDRPVEEFINRLKSSQLFRTIQISTERPQAGQLAQALPHFIQNRIQSSNPKKLETIGVSGVVRGIDSWFIFIEVLGENMSIQTVLANTAGFWRVNNNRDKKSSPVDLSNLGVGPIHWHDPFSQLSLVLASTSVSYGYARMGRRTFLVLQVTLTQIFPLDWTTPLDSINQILVDLRHRTNSPPVRILTTVDGSEQEVFTEAVRSLGDKSGQSSGFAFCNMSAFSYMRIKREPTQPENISSPVLSLGHALTLVANSYMKGNENADQAQNPNHNTTLASLLFPGGLVTTGLIPIWATTSLLDVALVTQYEAPLTLQTMWTKDSDGIYWDTVLLFGGVLNTYGKPSHPGFAYSMLNAYLALNNLPGFIEDPSLERKIPLEIPKVDTVEHYKLSDYGYFDGFALKYRCGFGFPDNFSVKHIALGLFQLVFQEALKLKLLSTLNGNMLKVVKDKDNQYTCIFIGAGKDGGIKWFNEINSCFFKNSLLWNNSYSEKAEKIKHHLSKYCSLLHIESTFGIFEDKVVSIVNLEADAETVAVDQIVSRRIREFKDNVPISKCIDQDVKQLVPGYDPLFYSFTNLDKDHLRLSTEIGVSVLIRTIENITFSLLIIVYSAPQLDKIGDALLHSVTKQPLEPIAQPSDAELNVNLAKSRVGLIATARFIASCIHVEGREEYDKLKGMITLFDAIRTPPPQHILGGGTNLPEILTNQNNTQFLLWTHVDVGVHYRIATTYTVSGFSTRYSNNKTIFTVLYHPFPLLTTFKSFISEFVKTLVPSSWHKIRFTAELSHLAGALGVAMTLNGDNNSAKLVSLEGAFALVVPLDGPLTVKAVVAHLLTTDNPLTSGTDYDLSRFQTEENLPPGFISNGNCYKETLRAMLGSSSVGGAQTFLVDGNHFAAILFDQNPPPLYKELNWFKGFRHDSTLYNIASKIAAELAENYYYDLDSSHVDLLYNGKIIGFRAVILQGDKGVKISELEMQRKEDFLPMTKNVVDSKSKIPETIFRLRGNLTLMGPVKMGNQHVEVPKNEYRLHALPDTSNTGGWLGAAECEMATKVYVFVYKTTTRK